MNQADSLYASALDEYQKKQIPAAIQLLEQAIQLDSNHQDALEMLGVLYAQNNRLAEAVCVMKRLVEVNPSHIMAHTNLSRFYVEQGMILEAEQEQAEARLLSWKAELKAQKETQSQEAKEKTSEEQERGPVIQR